MSVVEDLYISLGLNTKEAEKKLQQFQNSFKTLLSIGGSFAGIFSLSNVINKFVETNKSINNLSNSLGESYQDIQQATVLVLLSPYLLLGYSTDQEVHL